MKRRLLIALVVVAFMLPAAMAIAGPRDYPGDSRQGTYAGAVTDTLLWEPAHNFRTGKHNSIVLTGYVISAQHASGTEVAIEASDSIVKVYVNASEPHISPYVDGPLKVLPNGEAISVTTDEGGVTISLFGYEIVD